MSVKRTVHLIHNDTSVIQLPEKNSAWMDILVTIVWMVRWKSDSIVSTVLCFVSSRLDLRACEDQPCLNNGTCVVYLRSYLCQCQRGFTGRSCETSKPFAKIVSADQHQGWNSLRCRFIRSAGARERLSMRSRNLCSRWLFDRRKMYLPWWMAIDSLWWIADST